MELIISYHITSHHIISFHIISHHLTSHHITSYHLTSYHIISPHHPPPAGRLARISYPGMELIGKCVIGHDSISIISLINAKEIGLTVSCSSDGSIKLWSRDLRGNSIMKLQHYYCANPRRIDAARSNFIINGVINHPFTLQLTHSLTHQLTHSLTHSPTR